MTLVVLINALVFFFAFELRLLDGAQMLLLLHIGPLVRLDRALKFELVDVDLLLRLE